MASNIIESLKTQEYLLNPDFSPDSYLPDSSGMKQIPDGCGIRSLMCENSVKAVLYSLGFKKTPLPKNSQYEWAYNKHNNFEVREKNGTSNLTELDSLVHTRDLLATVEVKSGRVGNYTSHKVLNESRLIQEAYHEKPLHLLFLPYNRQRPADLKKIRALEKDFGVISIDTGWRVASLDGAVENFYEFQGSLCEEKLD